MVHVDSQYLSERVVMRNVLLAVMYGTATWGYTVLGEADSPHGDTAPEVVIGLV